MATPDPAAEETSAPTPSWIRVLGLVVLIAVVLFIVVMVATGGHTPRPHGP